MMLHKLSNIKGKDLPKEWQQQLGLEPEKHYVVTVAPQDLEVIEEALPIIELGYGAGEAQVPKGSTKDEWEQAAKTIRKADNE